MRAARPSELVTLPSVLVTRPSARPSELVTCLVLALVDMKHHSTHTRDARHPEVQQRRPGMSPGRQKHWELEPFLRLTIFCVLQNTFKIF